MGNGGNETLTGRERTGWTWLPQSFSVFLASHGCLFPSTAQGRRLGSARHGSPIPRGGSRRTLWFGSLDDRRCVTALRVATVDGRLAKQRARPAVTMGPVLATPIKIRTNQDSPVLIVPSSESLHVFLVASLLLRQSAAAALRERRPGLQATSSLVPAITRRRRWAPENFPGPPHSARVRRCRAS